MAFYGLHKYTSCSPMARHRHADPYMAIVVDGGYLEAGDGGRLEARPGDVLLHEAFEAHQDNFEPGGATVLNLPLEPGRPSSVGWIDDVDAIVRLAERDLLEAAAEARSRMGIGRGILCDWPDLLAKALQDNPDLAISDWADRMGLAAASVSRGFVRAYGVSPKRFRLEARTLRAVRALPHCQGGLAFFAAELGFADQSHMSRAISAMTGQSPRRVRAKCVQSNCR